PVLLGRLDAFEWHGEAGRMFTVELYAGIRRAVMVDGLSRREAAKRFGVHRNTITKMLQFSIPPGQAQADFGQADGYIAGKKVRFHYFCVDLPHADGCFVKAYLAETAEAFCDGHVAAFDFFGGVPQSILYDNTRLAVARIVKGGKRLRSQMFAELQSHYLFDDRFGRPGKGNDKGKVEGLVGYVRRNFMTPLPVADSFDALNARFLDACAKRRQAVLRGQATTIAERMQADVAAFMDLPAAPYEACHKVATRVSSLSLVRYKNNDYSV